MKNYIKILIGLLWFNTTLTAQTIITLNQPEAANGNVTHVANTSVNFQPDYHYSPLTASSIHAYIDESVTGNTSPGGLMTGGIGGSFDGREINTGLAVGTISGNQGVSPSGAATYSIPIKLPPGTNGMAPSLSINYNSQSGNGLLGFGWNLSGLSAILRTPKNIYTDSKVKSVQLDITDVFSLDGNRLILSNGTYGTDGAIYAFENEMFSRITSYGTTGNGPDWFEVKTKDGLVMEYGKTLDSKLILSGNNTVSSWAANKITDNYGNYYLLTYRTENNELLIDKIEYTKNTNMALETYNSIQFIYDERQDKNCTYIKNTSSQSNVILTAIKIKSEQNLVNKYSFNYGYDLYTYLTEVVESGSDGSLINSTIFKYGEKINSVSLVNVTDLSPNGISAQYRSGDFNGDGKADLLAFDWDIDLSDGKGQVWTGWDIYLSQGNSQFDKVLSQQSFPGTESLIIDASYPLDQQSIRNTKSTTLDFNGDGKTDIMFVTSSVESQNATTATVKYTFWPFLADFTGGSMFQQLPSIVIDNLIDFIPQNNQQPKPEGELNFRYLDLDGNGSSEIFLAYQDLAGNYHLQSINNANLSDPINIDNVMSPYYRDIYDYSFSESYPMDIDGDGKIELGDIKKLSTSQYHFLSLFEDIPTLQIRVQPSHFQDLNYTNLRTELFGDFNGDGLIDQFHTYPFPPWPGWICKYNIGSSFENKTFANQFLSPFNQGTIGNSTTYNYGAVHYAVDMNGDGKTDIVEFESSTTINVHYSNGTNFNKRSYSYNLAIDFQYDEIGFSDFNGDGLIDIFVNSGHSTSIIYVEKESKERLLHGIKDGFNNTTEFTYDNITNNNIYTKGNSYTYPFIDLQNPVTVVASVKAQNGVGGDDITTYKYEEAILHKEGKGFLGFKKTISENNTSNTRTTVEFGIDNTFIRSNLKKINTALISPYQPLSETEYFYDYSNLGLGNKRFLNTVSQKVQKNLLNNFNITTNYSTYDDYGNVEVTTIDKGGIETITINNVYESRGNWGANNRLISSQTSVSRPSSGTPPYVRSSTYTYNTQGSLKTETLDNGVTTTFDYTNGFGNITKSTVAGASIRTNEFFYDAKGRFVEKTINPLQQQSFATYDNRWGVPLTQTGVDGLTTTYQYDGFGRLIKTTTPDNIITETILAWEIGGGGATNPISADNSIYTSKTTSTQSPTTKVWYDSFGRPRKNSVDGFDNIINQVTTYDARGNVATTTTPFFATDMPKITSYTYDAYNMNNSIINDVSTTTIIRTLSSGTTTTTLTPSNGIGNPTTSTTVTDPTGKIISVTDAGGTLTYTYYSSGLQKDIKLDGVEVAYMEYNLFGNQTLLRDQNAGVTTYIPNSFGEVTTQTDAKGNIYVMTYDVMGRIETKTENGNPNFTTNYEYYGTGDNGVNQVKNITYNGITQHFTYDYLGRLTENKETIGADEYKFGYLYDMYNRLQQTTYPSGFKTKHTYNNLSYPTSVTDEQDNLIWQVGSANVMNAYNQYKTYALGNGQTTTKTYDDYGLLTSISASNPDIQNLVLNFNPANGNLMSRERLTTGTRIGVLEGFTYDDLNRLTITKIDGTVQQTMQYQANGNIGFKTDAGNYSYHVNKKNAVVQVSNPIGDISSNVQDITYTPFNSVSTIIENNKQLTFTYAADQQRRKMEYLNNNILQKTTYYLGNYEKIVNEITGDVTELHYIAGGDGLAAIHVITTPNNQQPTAKTFYTYTDYLGSILTLTDESANIVYEQNFDAWGKERNPDDWSYNSVTAMGSVANFSWLTRGYTGHEHLPPLSGGVGVGSSLINMNGRCYDPVLGRMLSPDNYVQSPFSTQSYNRYSYVVNNPFKFTDPSGEFPWLALGVLAAFNYLYMASQNDWKFNPLDWSDKNSKGEDIYYVVGLTGNSGGVQSVSLGGGSGPNVMTTFNFDAGSGNVGTINWGNIDIARNENSGGTPNTGLFGEPYASTSYQAGFPQGSAWNGENGVLTDALMNGLSTANGWFGTAVEFGTVSTLAGQGQYITSKGLIRDVNFAKLTQHSTPYATAGKILKSFGRASVGIGVAVDSYAWWNNQISGAKFGLNTGVTAWGLGVGAAGMAVPAFIGGAMYFGIDTFYPGGINGAMQMNGRLIEQNQQILGPSFNLYRDY